MRLMQPRVDHRSALDGPMVKVDAGMPVYHVRYRYPHHAEASGYDRVCDYVGETIRLSEVLYWAGETVLRPYCLLQARNGGHYEYSRYDCVMELEVARHYSCHQDSLYHFVYAEKSFKNMARRRQNSSNRIVGTVHHPIDHMEWLFRDGLEHFKAFDELIVMSPDMVEPWEAVTGRSNVWFVPHGVDVEYFEMSRKGEGENRRCVFVGSHERDFDNLPGIVRRIVEECPHVTIDLVSSHPRCGEIAAMEPSCTWRRRIGNKEYRALLSKGDVLLLPLVRSTACNAVLEAMASGMAVVSNRGGIECYLDPWCSTLVDVGDVDAFVGAAVEMLNDERALSEMQRRARNRALLFSWERVARQTVEVYEAAFK